jgi:hypothetical protein
LPNVATAKAALFTKYGLGSKAKHSEPTNVVAGPFPRFERQARAEDAPRLFAQASGELPLEERALWEAAIQLDLVTLNTAEAQVTQGRTVAAWMAAQKPGAGSDRNGHPRKSFDRALLLALVMFNLLGLVALATAVVWVVGRFI